MTRISMVLISIVLVSQSVSRTKAKPTDAFVELTKQPYYVDKTELLHVISEFHSNYDFVACPSRFLKTSNLHMIKSFYQLEFDDDGSPKNYTDTETYSFFKNFKIFNRSNTFLENRLAHHPVMFIDLKYNISEVETIAQVDTLLNTKLRDAFQEYFDVLPKLTEPSGEEFAITKFETEFMQKLKNVSATQFDLSYGLYRLSNVLFKYFRRRVIILVDNYDHAANEAILKNHQLLGTDSVVYYFYTSVNTMFRKTFKDNRKFKNYALMTGISGRIEYADNEVTENRFLDEHNFTPYFGFTKDDVDELITRYKGVYTEFDLVRKFYFGYLTRLQQHDIYSPYSIIQYLLSKSNPNPNAMRLQSYWLDTDPNLEFVKQASKSVNFRQKLHEMVEDMSKYVRISSYHQSSPALDTFVRTINEKRPSFKGIHQLDVEYLFHHLLEVGYLSHAGAREGTNEYRIPSIDMDNGLKKVFEKLDVLNETTTTTIKTPKA